MIHCIFVLKPVAMHYSKSVSHHGNTSYLALLKASEGMGVWAYDVGLTAWKKKKPWDETDSKGKNVCKGLRN